MEEVGVEAAVVVVVEAAVVVVVEVAARHLLLSIIAHSKVCPSAATKRAFKRSDQLTRRAASVGITTVGGGGEKPAAGMPARGCAAVTSGRPGASADARRLRHERRRRRDHHEAAAGGEWVAAPQRRHGRLPPGGCGGATSGAGGGGPPPMIACAPGLARAVISPIESGAVGRATSASTHPIFIGIPTPDGSVSLSSSFARAASFRSTKATKPQWLRSRRSSSTEATSPDRLDRPETLEDAEEALLVQRRARVRRTGWSCRRPSRRTPSAEPSPSRLGSRSRAPSRARRACRGRPAPA